MTDNEKRYLVIDEAEQILHRLKPLEVKGFLFIVIPKEYDPADPSTSAYGNKILHPRHMSTQVVSDTNAWTFSEHFLSQIAKYDLNYRTGLPNSLSGKLHLWASEDVEESKRRKLSELLTRHRFSSRLSYFHTVYNHDNWRALMLLYSDLNEATLASSIEQNHQTLKPDLDMILDHLYRKYAKALNPFSNYRVLSPQCIQVLEHLSNGLPTSQIASQMKISEAGVNYHINKARDLLGGDNRTHLVSMAHRLGVI